VPKGLEEEVAAAAGPVHLFKVARHGSSSAAFISSVRPALALGSFGHGNRYGHPTPQVISRLEEV